MVLVNGAEGIGTGWSTKIPPFNPRDIIKNIKYYFFYYSVVTNSKTIYQIIICV